jgi:hypothetical protein
MNLNTQIASGACGYHKVMKNLCVPMELPMWAEDFFYSNSPQ